MMDVSFGTYHRDGYWSNITGSFVTRGLDYAQNRFYDPARGRFTTADPSGSSGHLQTPLSWNRYSYVMGDPVNSNDPTGLDGQCGPGQTWMGEGCYNYGGASSDLAAAYTQYAGRMQDEFDAGYANSLLRHHGINSSIYLQFMSSHQNLDIRTVVNANFQFSSPQQKALAYLYAAGLFDYIAGAIPSPAHGEGILITWKDGTQNQVKDLLNGGLFDSGPLGREHTGETGPNTDYRSSAFGPGVFKSTWEVCCPMQMLMLSILTIRLECCFTVFLNIELQVHGYRRCLCHEDYKCGSHSHHVDIGSFSVSRR